MPFLGSEPTDDDIDSVYRTGSRDSESVSAGPLDRQTPCAASTTRQRRSHIDSTAFHAASSGVGVVRDDAARRYRTHLSTIHRKALQLNRFSVNQLCDHNLLPAGRNCGNPSAVHAQSPQSIH